MRANRRRDTGPELALRRELHAEGFRYRVDFPVLPRRRADIVFPRQRVAVFVDGCWWHGCPTHGTTAMANSSYWTAKIEANRARDADTLARLEADGWTVVRIWEHTELGDAVAAVRGALRRSR